MSSNHNKSLVCYTKEKETKPEKQELLERFKSYKKVGAVLLGVAAGNFAEGICKVLTGQQTKDGSDSSRTVNL